jgi:hypothetical protein
MRNLRGDQDNCHPASMLTQHSQESSRVKSRSRTRLSGNFDPKANYRCMPVNNLISWESVIYHWINNRLQIYR